MSISGFSIIRNGFQYDYPFLEAIQSILPICDEFVIAIGDSSDGTRAAVVALNSPKIRIIDTVWDMSLRNGGEILAQQTNIALDAVQGDWAFYIQADEAIHENELEKITDATRRYQNDTDVEGLLSPYLHFWGDYQHIRTSRKTYRHEIRIIRTLKNTRSYRDAQGFRKFTQETSKKLQVKPIDATIYHYGYVRPPKVMQQKANDFHVLYHDDIWLKNNKSVHTIYEYEAVDWVEKFIGTHPAVMQERIAKQFWDFSWHPSQSNMTLKNKILHFIEQHSGYRIGEYRNYIKI
jgi:glycosyltransferase involved in cell wall biosynthesis